MRKKIALFFWINELIFHEKKVFALFFWINELIQKNRTKKNSMKH